MTLLVSKKNRTEKIGQKKQDGTIYAGVSPETGQAMYVAPHDSPLALKFVKAVEYTGSLRLNDKSDFRLPTESELKVILENKDKGGLRGTFNHFSYWSSTQWSMDKRYIVARERFDGEKAFYTKGRANYARPVRFGAVVRCPAKLKLVNIET